MNMWHIILRPPLCKLVSSIKDQDFIFEGFLMHPLALICANYGVPFTPKKGNVRRCTPCSCVPFCLFPAPGDKHFSSTAMRDKGRANNWLSRGQTYLLLFYEDFMLMVIMMIMIKNARKVNIGLVGPYNSSLNKLGLSCAKLSGA